MLCSIFISFKGDLETFSEVSATKLLLRQCEFDDALLHQNEFDLHGVQQEKSKGSGLFLHGLPPLANETGKLNYPFNRRNLRGITFYQHEKEAKPY
ncbi:MAG: hypothetical protein DWI08_04835 [Planctomycetota bacterium]|nr:MAG: hypothetical protein DWI08_04835 [Planctomycetota bacterium]